MNPGGLEVLVRQRRFAFVFGLSSFACLGLVVFIGAGAGCQFSHDQGQPDTFVPPSDVANDSDLVQPSVTAFDVQTTSDVEPDFSCQTKPYDAGAATDAAFEAGSDGAAPGGQMIDIGLKIYAFGSGNTEWLAGANVDVFFGDAMNGATPDVAGAVADDKGIVHIQAPAGWRIAYRIAKKTDADPKKAYEKFSDYDLQLPWVPGSVVDAAGITLAESQTLKLAIAGDSSYTPPAGTAIFATRVVDCLRRNMRNATLEVVDVDTGATLDVAKAQDCKTGVPCRVYMSDNEFPEASLPWTSRAGLVVIANLDASHHYRAIAKGKRTGSASFEVLGHRDIELQSDTIDVAYVYP